MELNDDSTSTRGAEPRAHSALAAAAPVAFIVAIIGLSVILVDPRGDIPLNDDWNFALAAWHFAETGEIMLARSTGMSLKLQVLWGALWTVIFGRSFEVLRASTLLLSFVTTSMIYGLLRLAGVGRRIALLAAIAGFFQPLYFWSSFTFMTHVPYVFLSLAAFGAMWWGLSRDRLAWFSAGVAAVLAACFIRQTGFIALFPPLLMLGIHRGALSPKWSRYVAVSLAALGVFAALYTTTDLLHGYPGTITLHTEIWSAPPDVVAGRVIDIAIKWTARTFQGGFFCFLPLVVFAARPILEFARSKRGMLLFLGILGFFAWAAADTVGYFPYGNVLLNFGYGPMTTRDFHPWRYPFPRHVPSGVLLLLTVAVTIGGAALLAWLVTGTRKRWRETTADALLFKLGALQCFAGTAVLWTSGLYFDRYAIDALYVLPLLFAVAGTQLASRVRVGAVLTALVACLTIYGMHEYIDWNRARWAAYRDLRARGVTLSQMDGGYEINQYLIGQFHGPLTLRLKGASVIDDRFIITLNEVSGYETITRHPYSSVFGLGRSDVFTQVRREGHPDTIE